MMRRDHGVAQPGFDFGIALDLVAGADFAPAVEIERLMVHHLARHLEPVHQRRQIVRRGKEVVADTRRIVRITRTQSYFAAAIRMQQRGPNTEAVAERRIDEREPQMRMMRRAAEHEFDIRHRKLGP